MTSDATNVRQVKACLDLLKLAEDARSAEARNLVLNDCRWRLLVVLGRMEQGAHYGPEFAHPMRPAADQARVCAEG